MVGKCCCIKFLMKNFFGKRRWRLTFKWSNLIFDFSQNCPFWAYVQNNMHIHFLVHGHSYWSMFSLITPSEGPKSFVNWFFKKSDHGSWTLKSDLEKLPSFIVRLCGPRCSPALKKHTYHNTPLCFHIQIEDAIICAWLVVDHKTLNHGCWSHQTPNES